MIAQLNMCFTTFFSSCQARKTLDPSNKVTSWQNTSLITRWLAICLESGSWHSVWFNIFSLFDLCCHLMESVSRYKDLRFANVMNTLFHRICTIFTIIHTSNFPHLIKFHLDSKFWNLQKSKHQYDKRVTKNLGI